MLPFTLKKLLLSIIIPFAIIKAAQSDIYIEEKITTAAGGNETQGIKRTYISKDKILLQDPAFSARVIFDYNRNKVYSINDSGKDISVYTAEKFTLPANADFYSDFADLRDSDFYVRESGNKKQMEKFSCFELVIYIPRIAAMMNLWFSTIDTSLIQHFVFLEKYNGILPKKILPFMKEKNACLIESATVIVRPNQPERYLKSELVKISFQDIPESAFSLPENYRILNIN